MASLPCSLWRGGASRAAMFLERDLPAPGAERDELLKRVIGAHDPTQVDGLGGAQVNTSKVAVVGPSTHPEAQVDYLSGLVGLGDGQIYYDNTCGNILAAVAPFALDRGLTSGATVLIHLVQGRAVVVEARLADPGLPAGQPQEVWLEFSRAAGPACLPTGQVREELDGVSVTILDAASCVVMVRLESIWPSGKVPEGLTGPNLPEPVVEALDRLHQRDGERLGMSPPGAANQSNRPFVAAVTADPQTDARVWLLGLHRLHPSLAGSAAVSLAAAARLPGSVLHELVRDPGSPHVRLAHSRGVLSLEAVARAGEGLGFERLGYRLTARKLMEGRVFTCP